MDRDSIDWIRSTTFTVGRRGYDKREVDRFLTKIADWLETGGADSARSELVRRELERVAEKTGAILLEAQQVGEQLRADAEQEAARLLEEARAEAGEVQEGADRYASSTRADVDAYSERTRIDADTYADETRGEADSYAARARREADDYSADVRSEAESRAAAVVEEANRRRADLEAVISDLEERRDTVLAEMKRLSSELVGTATQHHDGPAPAGSAGTEGGLDDAEEAFEEAESAHSGRA